MLEKVSAYYDREVETSLKATTSLIEPLMIAVMGVVVGTHRPGPAAADLQPQQAAVRKGRSRGGRFIGHSHVVPGSSKARADSGVPPVVLPAEQFKFPVHLLRRAGKQEGKLILDHLKRQSGAVTR